jgi:hypothetical protein
VLLYHGTSSACADRILDEGFDADAKRRNDPGDFGWGVYLTDSPFRARAYGEAVLEVEIDEDRFARLPNPYFLDGLEEVEPETWAEKLFHSVAFRGDAMVTVKGPNRIEACKEVTRNFTLRGFAGIITGPDRDGNFEVVVFHPAHGVTSVKLTGV